MTQVYRTAAAFEQALEQRLRTASATGVDFARRRQLVVFERFLARIALELGDAVTLKGGLAVELRVERARTTKDVDLRVTGSPDDILERLRRAAGRDLGDFKVFTIRPDERHPEIQNEGMQYEGLRFRAECTLAGKVYARPFGVDVAFGDPILGEPELKVAAFVELHEVEGAVAGDVAPGLGGDPGSVVEVGDEAVGEEVWRELDGDALGVAAGDLLSSGRGAFGRGGARGRDAGSVGAAAWLRGVVRGARCRVA
jgi:hypothetical protein